MAKRTITLTGRTPVTIDEAKWPVIASAADSEHDGEVECQANRKSSWWIKVRQHEDGRTLVYAGYSYTSHWRGERDYLAKRGVLLAGGDDALPDVVYQPEAVCDAIREVCDDMRSAEHYGDDADRWDTLAAECMADMPAEELS